MVKNFREKFEALPKKRQKKIKKAADDIVQEIQLAELRKLSDMTQQKLAEGLKKSQAAIAKLEKQRNMNINTLRELVEGMGCELDVSVRDSKKRKYRLASFSSKELTA